MDMEVKTWKIGTDDVGGSAAVAVAAGGFASGEVDAVGEPAPFSAPWLPTLLPVAPTPLHTASLP
jgi:hypothetical protein